jgi:hypothetical protein
MKLALFSTLLAAASAFAPNAAPKASTALHETKADLKTIAEKSNPIVKFYDPLSLSDAEFWGGENINNKYI